MIGQKYGKLTVISEVTDEFSKNKTKRRTAYLCLCDCGNNHTATRCSLIHGRVASCGCITKDRLANQGTHGHAKRGKQTRAYHIWNGMRSRCNNENSPRYSYYGARGIYVDDRWDKFEQFLEDMGEPPDGHSLDRIDNSGPYSKDNCRWADHKQQCGNTRSNRVITVNGRSMILADWARELRMAPTNLTKRIKLLGEHEAITRPIKRWKKLQSRYS